MKAQAMMNAVLFRGKPVAGKTHVAPSQCCGGTSRLDEEVAALVAMPCCRTMHMVIFAASIFAGVATSGYAPLKVIESVEPYIDLWLYDIKLLDSANCLKYTERPLKPVLENMRHLNAAKRRIVMR